MNRLPFYKSLSFIGSCCNLSKQTRKIAKENLMRDLVSRYLYKKYIREREADLKSTVCTAPTITNKIVWQYWSKGFEACPEIVKICLQSTHDAFTALGYEVILITDYNLSDFLSINDKIYKKIGRHGFSVTAYSDLIRCGLLSKFGGIWADATIFTSALPVHLASVPRFFYERSEEDPEQLREKMAQNDRLYFQWQKNVRVNWLSSIFAVPQEDPIISTMWNILSEYWEQEAYYYHYFLAHLIFDIIKNKITIPGYSYQSFSDSPPHLLQFALRNNSPLQNALSIIQQYSIHKLSYKFPSNIMQNKASLYSNFIRSNGFQNMLA